MFTQPLPVWKVLGQPVAVFFLLFFLFGMSLLSVLSCFLRQEPVYKQSQAVMPPLELAFWQLVTQQPWPHPLLIVDTCAQRNMLVTHLHQTTLGPEQRRQAVLHIVAKKSPAPGLQENDMKQGAGTGSILSLYPLNIPSSAPCTLTHLLHALSS